MTRRFQQAQYDVTDRYADDALDRALTSSNPSDAVKNVAYGYDQSGHGFGVGQLTSLTDAAGLVRGSDAPALPLFDEFPLPAF